VYVTLLSVALVLYRGLGWRQIRNCVGDPTFSGQGWSSGFSFLLSRRVPTGAPRTAGCGHRRPPQPHQRGQETALGTKQQYALLHIIFAVVMLGIWRHCFEGNGSDGGGSQVFSLRPSLDSIHTRYSSGYHVVTTQAWHHSQGRSCSVL
jgi:hypothetical protein